MSSSNMDEKSSRLYCFVLISLYLSRAVFVLVLLFVASSIYGQSKEGQNISHEISVDNNEPSIADNAGAGKVKVGKFETVIPNFIVLNQDGESVRFYTDLVKGKIVVLSFFYTDCSFTCDGQGRGFAKLQALLGDKLGREVFLVSVTRTPIADTPSKLKAWAKRYGVKRGWTLVTGKTPDIAKLVGTFAHDSLGPQEMHSAPIFIGNDATGAWLSSNGLAAPEQLIELINSVSAKTGDTGSLKSR